MGARYRELPALEGLSPATEDATGMPFSQQCQAYCIHHSHYPISLKNVYIGTQKPQCCDTLASAFTREIASRFSQRRDNGNSRRAGEALRYTTSGRLGTFFSSETLSFLYKKIRTIC